MIGEDIRAVLLHFGENMWCDWSDDPTVDVKLGAKAPRGVRHLPKRPGLTA